MATSRRRPFGKSSRPLDLEDAVARSLDKIGHLSDDSAKDQLRKAQRLLYEVQRADHDVGRIRAAAKLVRDAGISLMKVAAGSNAAVAASLHSKMSDDDA